MGVAQGIATAVFEVGLPKVMFGGSGIKGHKRHLIHGITAPLAMNAVIGQLRSTGSMQTVQFSLYSYAGLVTVEDRAAGPYCTGWLIHSGKDALLTVPQLKQVLRSARCSVTISFKGGRSNP